MSLALILAYAVLLLLVALALLWSHWPRWLKAMLVVAVTVLYFFGYDTVHGLLGLPSGDPLPARFVVLASAVEEPNQKSKGAIYLWLSPLEEGQASPQPRAYKVAYSRPLHEQVNQGMQKAREGVIQMGMAQPRPATGRESGWFGVKKKDGQEVKIGDVPASQLPEK